MKAQELRSKTVNELKSEMHARLKEIFNLRMQKGAGEAAPKPHLFKIARRAIARIKTILREKEGSSL